MSRCVFFNLSPNSSSTQTQFELEALLAIIAIVLFCCCRRFSLIKLARIAGRSTFPVVMFMDSVDMCMLALTVHASMCQMSLNVYVWLSLSRIQKLNKIRS